MYVAATIVVLDCIMVALAVGMLIGTAFGKILTLLLQSSLASDRLLTPFISHFLFPHAVFMD